MIRAAAVAGEPFEPDVAAEIAELDHDTGWRCSTSCSPSTCVRPTELPRRFAFRHPLVRRAVYASAPAGTRIAAHGRAAAALASRGAPATARAHHVEHAAHRATRKRSRMLLEAGDGQRKPSPRPSRRAGSRRRCDCCPPPTSTQQVAVRRQLAQALRSCGQLEPCRAVLLEAIELIADDADPTLIELTTRCAAVERWLGQRATRPASA